MSRAKGNDAESLACVYLEQNGFSIIERNFFAKYGEIDIIATKNNILHFVEVKSGVGFEPIYNITKAKIIKLQRAVGYYLVKNKLNVAYCLDAIIIKGEDIEMIENITM